ncbi:DNA polymerase III subunit gamma/tau [Xanthomonas sp. XNM01]|uniref:DNA polymerase III subunit gamma/tau n=1 Tax=Xanthomonas sp. XNM01 TaxID=2769289 RepID=UPI00177F3868|nr:DNA polymerase III subunit gamma/tau [Xanthomonas sp. XNM01]MBD9368707.1 DNA polymerase III subunit gamma/tau [Xanthomonas sp. XNM01]
MSYLVLARKWRPKRFSELVGQEHVVRALGNALDTGRVHHAFLFTGTRGVGKTTIARIFAKSLNCEQGTSAEPCGTCAACTDIDAGRYIDLLEIDAASNTGVDDVREVIENAQYMPSRGKYKVYLIDEVHMLSKAAFNALLKTLEEPPGHVKFLLATTDPQKLPVTVLSRCLQFNLKRLDEDQIEGQMTRILAAEQIEADADAIRQLSRAADGSLRDGLSLLDQAIAYAGGALRSDVVRGMLGSVDRTQVGALLDALRDADGQRLLQTVESLAGFSPDWGNVLEAMAEALHRIQVRQLVPGAPVDAEQLDVDGFAAALRPEVVQLWYQMAVNGKRELELAPSHRVGFEMTVLRMLAFRPHDVAQPVTGGSAPAGSGRTAGTGTPDPASGMASAAAASKEVDEAAPVSAAPQPEAALAETAPVPPQAQTPAPSGIRPPAPDMAMAPPPQEPVPVQTEAAPAIPAAAEPAVHVAPPAPPASAPIIVARAAVPAIEGRVIDDAEDWLQRVTTSDLRGPAKMLAAHSAFVSHANGVLTLALDPGFEYLRGDSQVAALAEALALQLGSAPKIVFDASAAADAETLHRRIDRDRDSRQAAAEDSFLNDPDVKRLIEQHGARVVPDSIRPYSE